MAGMNYFTGHFSGGLSGESFDIAQGYAVSYSTTAGDLVFAASGKTLTLTTGTWPTWIREIGKTFVTDSVTNPGPFTVVSIDVTNKILTVLETVSNETPVGVTVVNGSADTKLISNLLKAGNGVLTTDTPLVLYSTGALTTARTLDISALEAESVQQGGEALNGRFFYLSVQNSDISPSVSLTVNSSATINGLSTLVIKKATDYLFFHEAAGVWRCNVLSRPGEAHATIAQIDFTAADWNAGAVKNQIKVIQTGVAAAGEVGPHNLKVYPQYVVEVINKDLTPFEAVDVEVQFDNSGNVTMVKAQKAKPFNGTIVLIGSLE